MSKESEIRLRLQGIVLRLNRHASYYGAGFYGSSGGRFKKARLAGNDIEVNDGERWFKVRRGERFQDHNLRPIVIYPESEDEILAGDFKKDFRPGIVSRLINAHINENFPTEIRTSDGLAVFGARVRNGGLQLRTYTNAWLFTRPGTSFHDALGRHLIDYIDR